MADPKKVDPGSELQNTSSSFLLFSSSEDNVVQKLNPVERSQEIKSEKTIILEQTIKPLVDVLKTSSEASLNLLAPRELSGDEKEGVTESKYKMVLLTVMAVHPKFADQTKSCYIGSEFVVEGGRIDIFFLAKDYSFGLVIELKYIRIGFVAEWIRGQPEYERYALWKKTNSTILALSNENVKRVTYRSWGTKEVKPLGQEMKDAENQAIRYCKALRSGGNINPYSKEKLPHLFYVALVGIGTRTVISDIGYYSDDD